MSLNAHSITLPSQADCQVRILNTLAKELTIGLHQVSATVNLLNEGSTVPFIARYRKEVTGGLDDTVLRELEQRLSYLTDMEERRLAILQSIQEQDKLSPELFAALDQADTKQRLEDLYAPFKPKRRTRAQIAREAGLEPLADQLLSDRQADPHTLATDFLNEHITDVKSALDGARDILSERFAENADLVDHLRQFLWKSALLYSNVVEGKENEAANFKDWFDFSERLQTLPSHRVLALLRGRQQGFLDVKIGLDPEQEALLPHPCIVKVASQLSLGSLFNDTASTRERWLAEVCRWTWRVKLLPSFESEFITKLREDAETEAIRVFALNLKDLLLAAPAGPKTVIGLDPGIRTGVKVAVIDHTGKLLETATIYPHEPRKDWQGSLATLATIAHRHKVELVAIGNGTASRETERLVLDLMKQMPQLNLTKIVVSEAGASVYSASELAAKEFPELDVSLRGAVSIARRLQDPLAELVKIDPKSIGVGQYQHDVNQRALTQMLENVVEDCVNAVGVDVNTASAELLSYVSGLNTTLAKNIVQWRDTHGAFHNRKQLKEVSRFGEKAFEQAAGFLKVSQGENPLDMSSVHPEAYPVVEKILAKIKKDIRSVIGNKEALLGLSPAEFTDEKFGIPTVKDILSELEKPGRDPRPEFTTASFMDGVEDINDLQIGMVLEGVVTNVANFGAFVDIGVHQDGLVHISALAEKFVSDPRDIVRVGQTVKVKVIEVDVPRKRISLSMRMDDETGVKTGATARTRSSTSTPTSKNDVKSQGNTAMAAAFAKLKR